MISVVGGQLAVHMVWVTVSTVSVHLNLFPWERLLSEAKS